MSRPTFRMKIGKIKRQIVLGLPHKMEMLALSLFFIFGLWFDVVQNKVLDHGMAYKVTWFGSVQSSAIDLAGVLFIMFHLCLMALFLMSLKSKATSAYFDVIVGVIGFLGVAIMLAGFYLGIFDAMVRFLFIDMSAISFYHIGIAMEAFVGLYYTITK